MNIIEYYTTDKGNKSDLLIGREKSSKYYWMKKKCCRIIQSVIYIHKFRKHAR